MAKYEIEIDFSTGTIVLSGENGRENVKSLLGKSPSLRLDNLSLKGVEVSLSALTEGGVLLVNIFPPSNLGFEGTEVRAVEIAKALATVCPKQIYPMNQYASFNWGELTLRTEWRDGGYGAEFKYAAPNI